MEGKTKLISKMEMWMESVSEIEDYMRTRSDFLGQLAVLTTCIELVASVLLNNAHKNAAGYQKPPGSFLHGITVAICRFMLGVIANDGPIMKTNLIVLTVNMICFVIYYTNAPETLRTRCLIHVATTVVFISAVYAYATRLAPDTMEDRLAILTATMTIMSVMISMFRSKNSPSGLEVTCSISGLYILWGMVVAAIWTMYGLSKGNLIMTCQYLILFVLGLVHMIILALPSDDDDDDSTIHHRMSDSSLYSTLSSTSFARTGLSRTELGSVCSVCGLRLD